MDTELVILALAFGIVGLIFLVIAIISDATPVRVGHGFKSDKVWDLKRATLIVQDVWRNG